VINNFQNIISENDKRLDAFRSLKIQGNRYTSEGLFVVEGEVSFLALIASGLKMRTVLLEDKHTEKYRRAIDEKFIKEPIEVLIASRSIISEVLGFRFHQGVLALAERPKKIALDKLPLPAIALNRVEKAENVGALIRTAVGFGIESFIIDGGSCDPFVRKALRCAMGSSLFCNFSYVDDLCKVFSGAPNLRILAIEQHPSAIPLSSRLPDFDILVLGNEADGMSDDILEIARQIIEIPINSKRVASLNIAVALGIVMSRMAR